MFKTLDDFNLSGQRVLIRVDLNAPVKNGGVTDNTRLLAIKDTVQDVLAKGGKPILLAHFGRPKGQREPSLSFAPLVDDIVAAIDAPVFFVPDCIGKVAATSIDMVRPGGVVLLENTRFHAGEEKNDPAFVKELAALGDVYVNDAFSTAHRAHATTEGLARSLPAAAGRLMQKELEALSAALTAPARPVIAVVGGAKVSTKLALLGNLCARVDQIIIGGGMANTFLAAMGAEVGKSLCEHDMIDTARQIMSKANEAGCEIVLPSDVVVAKELKASAASEVVSSMACPADAMILDAGPASTADIKQRFDTAKTLVWNGPLGAFEVEPFNAATDAAARHAADLTRAGGLLTVAGGGDTVAALNASGAGADFSYLSTAGGAFLEWLEGKTLPGIAALQGD